MAGFALRSNIVAAVQIMLVSSLVPRQGSILLVRAFARNPLTKRAVLAAWSSQARVPQQHRRLKSGLAVSIEQDLDAALSDILSESSGAKKKPRKKLVAVPPRKEEASFEGVTLDDLLEVNNPDIEVDYNDPKFLNIKNPFWTENGLSPKIIDVLSEKGITQFTPVQAEAFVPVLGRRDVIGRSRTGTGKTLAFGLPGLTRLVKFAEAKGFRTAEGYMQRGRPISMLVLCPTRELARQVSEELSLAAKPLGLYVDVFHGGVSYDPQARALRTGVDVVVGTPGRIIDHINRGNLKLAHCDLVVLDEADEMLNMGFAEDVEVILKGVGSENDDKTQCLLFSATTPDWVKTIAARYQENVFQIDSTGNQGARVATTVTHRAIQLPPGVEAKKQALEDIIAVEISRNKGAASDVTTDFSDNPIAAAAHAKKGRAAHAMQQKIFGKTIVFTETKREADELVSGSVFKTLTAQAIHGDVGQKQRDATLNAFRSGAFNVLVATDVAARGIDIQDVDLVVQFDPPRDVDTYVHRSGRTGRAGASGVSVLLFSRQQSRDIVRIERDLGHGFKFDLVGPPSIDTAMRAAAKTSASACLTIPDDTVEYFMEEAALLLEEADSPEEIVARCLAAISRRSTDVQSRSLITGELGLATVEMSYGNDKIVAQGDVIFTVGKLARMSSGELKFDSDVGKIQIQPEEGTAIFDLGVEDARRLVEFSQQEGVDTYGAKFELVDELEVTRDRFFGQDRGRSDNRRGGGRFGGGSRGGRFNDNYQQGGGRSYGGVRQGGARSYGGDRPGVYKSYGGDRQGTGRSYGGDRPEGGYRGNREFNGNRGRDGGGYRSVNRDETHRGWANHEKRDGGRGSGGDSRTRYDSPRNNSAGGW